LLGSFGWAIAGLFFWAGSLYFGLRGVYRLIRSWPSEQDAQLYAEHKAAMPYRPLEILQDVPAGTMNKKQRKMWQIAIKRAEQDAKNLRFIKPTLWLTNLDQYGFRIMAMILMIIGLVMAQSNAQTRLFKGLLPIAGLGSLASTNVTIWIQPPDYTGLKDIVLDDPVKRDRIILEAASAPKTIGLPRFPIIPEGSRINITAKGVFGPAWFSLGNVTGRVPYIEAQDSHFLSFTPPALIQNTEEQPVFSSLRGEDAAPRSRDANDQEIQLSLKNIFMTFADATLAYRPDHAPLIAWEDDIQQKLSSIKKGGDGAPFQNEEENPLDAPDSELFQFDPNAIDPTSFQPDDTLGNLNRDPRLFDSLPPVPYALPEHTPFGFEGYNDPENNKKQKDTASASAAAAQEDEAALYAMRFPLRVQDDYGIDLLRFHIALHPDIATDGTPALAPNPEHITLERSIRSGAGQEASIAPLFDLSDHYWAGLPVMISVSALDKAGQSTSLPPRPFVLKHRKFSHRLAQHLSNLRRMLIWDGVQAAQNVAFDLKMQLRYPEDMRHDMSVWATLKTISEQLEKIALHGTDHPESLHLITEALWETSLGLEDMGLSQAARDLQRATDAISLALRRSTTSPERTQKLFDDYKGALSHYLDTLRALNENRDLTSLDIPRDAMRDLLNPAPLNDMLAQMEDFMALGDFENLEEMIARMRALLESFALGGALPPEMQALERGMNVIQGLIDNQKSLKAQSEALAENIPQALLDQEKQSEQRMLEQQRARREKQQERMRMPFPDLLLDERFSQTPETEPQTPKATPREAFPLPPADDEADIQYVLRFILGDLMGEIYDRTNELPETMPLAELEMRNSTDKLDERRPDRSIPIQEEVIRLLEQAQQDMQQSMREAMARQSGMSGFGRPQAGTDPLGRRSGDDPEGTDLDDETDVEVPDQFEKKKIDDILDYLRRNLGDAERSRIEREYFKRLLRRYQDQG
jgi:hypothetical protein